MAAKNESPFQTAFTVSIEAREGITTGISAHDRAHTIQVAIDPSSRPAGPRPARPHLPAQGQGRRRARAHRPDRGGGRPRAAGRPQPERRDLRGHERRRHDGARARPRALLRQARAEDDHGRRPDRLPPPARQARRARGRGAAADRSSATSRSSASARWSTTSTTSRWSRARSTASDGRARARALGVPHRRRLPLAALRLRPAARGRAGADRAGGARRAALPRPGGARHRPAQQAARLQAPGGGPRHGRRQPRARPARRPARLRHRRADPGRPRAHARSGC